MSRIIIMAIFVFSVLAAPWGVSSTILSERLVGAKKCRVCHNRRYMGKQYACWRKMKLARAFHILQSQRGREVAASVGVADPTTDGRCLRCHSTSYYFSRNRVSKNVALQEGVSCESCHGAGRLYRNVFTMKRRKRAVRRGLQANPEKTCIKCHNENSPCYKKFDYESYFSRISHPRKKRTRK